jgi:hypothetical protein
MGTGVRRVKRDRVPGGESQIEWRLQMMYRIAFPMLALLVAGGCSAKDATGPMSQTRSAGASAAAQSENSPRSGALHLVKDCIGTYLGRAGDFCTITKSNLEQIKLGSRVVYQTAAGATSLNSDVILYPPNSGKNLAFGHCALDFASGLGHCTFSGGTGRFKEFHASVTVTCAQGICALDGTYTFNNKNDEDGED